MAVAAIVLAMLEIPIFPLPELVFFPKTMLPLHIFEARYKQMVAHALRGNRLLGIVLLKPGWESSYHGSPETYDVGCLGRIHQVEQLEDGKYNLVLLGIQKIRISQYMRMEPFRIAQVELLEDKPIDEDDSLLTAEKAELLEVYHKVTHWADADAPKESPSSMEQFSYEALVNNLAMSSHLDIPIKQVLLEIDEVRFRGRSLSQILHKQLAAYEFCEQYRHLTARDPSSN